MVADFGSGSGIPAIPLAIAEPERTWTLIEADTRKAAFLNTVRRSLDLPNVTVVARRIEDVPPLGVGEITARAFAPLARILPLALRHLRADGRLILPKGETVEEEIREAARTHDFDHELHPARDPRGAILTVRRIRKIA